MRMPGFTAETSIYKGAVHYQTVASLTNLGTFGSYNLSIASDSPLGQTQRQNCTSDIVVQYETALHGWEPVAYPVQPAAIIGHNGNGGSRVNCGPYESYCEDSQSCVMTSCPPSVVACSCSHSGGPCGLGCSCDAALCPEGHGLATGATIDNGCPCVPLKCGKGETVCLGACCGYHCCPGIAQTGGCRDLQTDGGNCGSCGNLCPDHQTCQSGVCACADGQTDLSRSITDCGSCGYACSQYVPQGSTATGCSDGHCNWQCNSGYQNCTGSTCSPCPTGPTVCSNGECVCASGYTNCGGNCVQCSANSVCQGITCVPCGRGLSACGGTCTNTQSDNNNCGTCGVVCQRGQTCQGGSCACPGAAPNLCNGVCTNFESDDNNCGGCSSPALGNYACDIYGPCVHGCCKGTGRCGTGSGSIGCPGGLQPCGSDCYDPSQKQCCNGGHLCGNTDDDGNDLYCCDNVGTCSPDCS